MRFKTQPGILLGGRPVVIDKDGTLEQSIRSSFGDALFASPEQSNAVTDRRVLGVQSLGSVGERLPAGNPGRPRPELHLNQLYWPNDASRWGEAFFVMSTSDALALRDRWGMVPSKSKPPAWQYAPLRNTVLEWSYPAGAVANDAADSGEETRFKAHMYVHSMQPLFGDSYLVHLVDARWYWQFLGLGCELSMPPVGVAEPSPFSDSYPHRGGATVTWEDFIDTITSGLRGMLNPTSGAVVMDAIESQWLLPSVDEFARVGESITQVMDAVAQSLGRVWALDMRTNQLCLLSPGLQTTYPGTVPAGRRLVGEPDVPGPSWSHLVVLYPRCVDGHVLTQGERYYWQALGYHGTTWADYFAMSPVDRDNNPMSGDGDINTAYALGMTCVVHSACHADFRGTNTAPENIIALDDLTRAIAYRAAVNSYSCLAGLFEYLPTSSVPSVLNPFCDYMLYNLAVEDQPSYALLTPQPSKADREAAPPILSVTRSRRVSARFMSRQLWPSRVQLSYDSSVPILYQPLFRIQAAYTVEALHPGQFAYAQAVTYDTGTSAFIAVTPALEQVKIYDPQYHAFALPNEIVRCVWSDERERWEVAVPYGLDRKAVVMSVSGIAAGASGACEVWHNDAASGEFVSAWLLWMEQGQSVAYNKEINVRYDTGEKRWWIPGAECPGGSSSSSH